MARGKRKSRSWRERSENERRLRIEGSGGRLETI